MSGSKLTGNVGPQDIPLSRISEAVYTYQPSHAENTPEVDPNAPKVILIFAWMDAPVKHLTKYLSDYAELYPHALQVLTMTKQSIYWTRRGKKLSTVRPILSILQEQGYFSKSPPNLLVHVFSDGGSVYFNLLSELIRETPNLQVEQTTPPATVFVFDSLPGNAGLGPGLKAHTAEFHSPIIKYLAYVPLTIIWSVVMGTAYLMGQHDPITTMRLGLNKADVLPWTDEKTPRVYIYSKEDKIVNFKSVEEHVAQARKAGLTVTTELFKGSGHVSHMRRDPTRYWDINRRIWAEGLKQRSRL